MTSAASKAFAIPELLEQILMDTCCEECDSRWLFVLQRVDSAFKDTIQGSTQLLRLTGIKHQYSTPCSLPLREFLKMALNSVFDDLLCHTRGGIGGAMLCKGSRDST